MLEGNQFVETFRRLSLCGSRAAATAATAAAATARLEGPGVKRRRRSSTPIVIPFDSRPDQGIAPQASPAKSDVTMEDVSGDVEQILNEPALPKPPRYKGRNVDVIEDEWVKYFLQAKHTAFEDYAVLGVARQKLSMDTKLAEAESCVNRLQANMYRILEDHNMVDVMFDREQKKLVKYLVASLEPISFKEIQRRIEQEQNKRYKSNVIEFSHWFTELLASFMVWEKSIVPQVGGTKIRHQEGPAEAKSSLAMFEVQVNRTLGEEVPTSPTGGGKTIEKEWSAPAADKMGGDDGTLNATVFDLAVKASLLDSGADASSVSRGCIAELHKRGCFVAVIKRDQPQEFDPFGPGTVNLYQQARYEKVVLHTSAGPLVLRNLECWIDESDLTLVLTVGRPAMAGLGYSTDGY
ncbi:hypothetical protein ON010_g15423 [Phytophthora cinnamomi]|nr:hypothetical protein ON010_g15423 [Phytophthora cinnamomi]